jgi:hypothetical protein
VHLNASHNALTGPLPATLHALTVIDLQYNDLEGPLPKAWGTNNKGSGDGDGGCGQGGSMGHAANVRVVALSNNNRVNGTIPASWGNLGLLELELSHMQLTGTVSPDRLTSRLAA